MMYVLCLVGIIATAIISGIVWYNAGDDSGFERGYNISRRLDECIPKKIECKVCGSKFDYDISKVYQTRESVETGIKAAISGGIEPKIFDTIDCPNCGCQNYLAVRQRTYIQNTNLNIIDEEC